MIGSLVGRSKQSVNAPNVGRVTQDDLGGMIEYRRNVLRDRKWQPMGKLMSITFGMSANAALENAQAGKTVRQRMMTLDWMEKDAPVLGSAGNGVFVFPIGFERPTKLMKDTYINVVQDPKCPAPKFEQDIYDFADGWFASTDGRTKFLVFQPVTSLVIRAVVFMPMRGEMDPATGRKPALLYDPRSKEAHLLGGVIF
jgi:hypothetical protein